MTENLRKFHFRKLVRDRTVPDYEEEASVVGMSHRTLRGIDLIRELIAKVHEERMRFLLLTTRLKQSLVKLSQRLLTWKMSWRRLKNTMESPML